MGNKKNIVMKAEIGKDKEGIPESVVLIPAAEIKQGIIEELPGCINQPFSSEEGFLHEIKKETVKQEPLDDQLPKEHMSTDANEVVIKEEYDENDSVSDTTDSLSISELPRLKKANEKQYGENKFDIKKKTTNVSVSVSNHKTTDVNKKYKCDKCNMVFATSVLLTSHRYIHRDFKTYQCDVCKREFIAFSQLLKHKKCSKKYHCTVCNMDFESACHSLKHKSDDCEEKQDSKRKLNDCGKKRNQSKKKQCKTRQCDISELPRLKKANEKKSGEKKFDIQNKSVNVSVSVSNHKTTDVNKKYKCDKCNMAFATHVLLTSHRYIHRDFHTYQCGVCEKEFIGSYALLKHKKCSKKCHCTVCNMDFESACHLLKHKSDDCEEKQDSSKRKLNDCGKKRNQSKKQCKTRQCDICKKTFSRGYLPKHKLTHSDTKNFKCNVCDKAFNQFRGLALHTFVHTDIGKHLTRYQCDVCSDIFKSEYERWVHKLESHAKHHVCNVCGKSFNTYFRFREHKLSVPQCDTTSTVSLT